ncbi:alpha/beta hydrolase [uncultured Alistipes sp.]|uniref:alpha/beta hydrolase n=1 Tax=uncultured Alistipes sp. TaxID=538949 RepID=UPI002610F481|nr:alpha/beta hydrolase [uncultured Alistipes sp.]
MKNLLIVVFGFLVTGCCHSSGQQKPSVACDTFDYAVKEGDTLRMDRYTLPAWDKESRRPCLIFLFGGAFTHGTRNAGQYRPFFDYLVEELGYTVVSIDYRLGLKEPLAAGQLTPESFTQLLPQAVLMAVEDLYDATSYVVSRADEWHIDADGIVACGSSAGAISVLQGAYMIANGSRLTAKLPESFNYAGVISFAGAIVDMGGDLKWANAPAPVMLFHGDADSNVPYGALRLGAAGIFGSKYIAAQLAGMKSPYYFYSVENADHAMATVPMNNYRDAISYFLVRMVGEGLPAMVDTDERFTYSTPMNKEFTIADYIRSNFME